MVHFSESKKREETDAGPDLVFLGQEKVAPAAANDGEVRVYERGFCQNLKFDDRRPKFSSPNIFRLGKVYHRWSK